MGFSCKYRPCERFIKRIKIIPKLIKEIDKSVENCSNNFNCPIYNVTSLINKKIDLIDEYVKKCNFLKNHFNKIELKICLLKYLYNVDIPTLSSRFRISERSLYRLLNKFDARVTGTYYEFI